MPGIDISLRLFWILHCTIQPIASCHLQGSILNFPPPKHSQKTYRYVKTNSVKYEQQRQENKPVFGDHFAVATEFLLCCFMATALFSRLTFLEVLESTRTNLKEAWRE